MVKRISIVIFCLLVFSSTAFAGEISAEKKADILKLFEISGTLDNARQAANFASQQMIDSIKKENPNVDPKIFKIISEETRKVYDENMDKFKEILIPIYDKYFTDEEIKEFINYCNSPIGKKVISVMPSLTQESMKAGQQWGENLAPTLIKRVVARAKKEGLADDRASN